VWFKANCHLRCDTVWCDRYVLMFQMHLLPHHQDSKFLWNLSVNLSYYAVSHPWRQLFFQSPPQKAQSCVWFTLHFLFPSCKLQW
jgi:hypothetical protein